MSDQRYRQPVIEEISLTTMSQRERQPEIGEKSSTMSEREHQQENGNWDTEKQSSGQDDPKGASIVKYHAIFIVLFGIAILYVDPLFFYIPVINQDAKCLKLDIKLMITAICLRFVFDMIYGGNIIFGYISRINGQTGLDQNGRQPRQIIKRYLRTYFLIDVLAILPIPQVLVPVTFTQMGTGWNFSNIMKVINFFVLLQYVPRVLRIYLSWKKHIKSSSKLYKGVRMKVVVLDDDVVVQQDLSELWNIDMRGKVNGAVQFCSLRFGQLKKYLGESSNDKNSCAWMSGLNVIDLVRWRELDLTETYQRLAQQLTTHEGSNEAIALRASLLSFEGLVFSIDGAWALSGLGHDYGIDIQAISKAAVLHYNGNMKPWLELGIPKYRRHWKKFLNREDQFLSECNVNS